MFNIAVIGCGRIAWLLENDPLRYKPCTHLGAIRHWLKKDRKIHVSALCDSEIDRAKGAANFLSAAEALITTTPGEALATRPELLVIAASTAAHFPLLQKALVAGIPRIVLEKPVVFSLAETRKLRKLLRKTRSVILPNYERRYHPKYIRLQQLIAKEKQPGSYRGFFAAGGTRRTQARAATDGIEANAGGKSLYADAKRGDEGVLLHDTTHLIDLAQFLYGPVKSRQVIAGKRRHIVELTHESGAVGSIETVLGIGAFHLELELHLSKERIIVGNGFLSRERITQSPHYKALRAYAAAVRTPDQPFPASKNPFVAIYREAIYGKSGNAHFLDALANVEILSGHFDSAPKTES